MIRELVEAYKEYLKQHYTVNGYDVRHAGTPAIYEISTPSFEDFIDWLEKREK